MLKRNIKQMSHLFIDEIRAFLFIWNKRSHLKKKKSSNPFKVE